MNWAIERKAEPGVPIPGSVGWPRWWLWLIARSMSNRAGHRYRIIRV